MLDITIEKLKEIEEILSGSGKIKEKFFNKFCPNIENLKDYSLIIPNTENKDILKFVEENNWIHIDRYAPTVFAINIKPIIDSWYD